MSIADKDERLTDERLLERDAALQSRGYESNQLTKSLITGFTQREEVFQTISRQEEREMIHAQFPRQVMSCYLPQITSFTMQTFVLKITCQIPQRID